MKRVLRLLLITYIVTVAVFSVFSSIAANTIMSTLLSPLTPILSMYASNSMNETLSNPISPEASLYSPHSVTETLNTPIDSPLILYNPHRHVSTYENPISPTANLYAPEKRVETLNVPLSADFLVARLVASIEKSLSPTLAPLEYLYGNIPVKQEKIVVEIPSRVPANSNIEVRVKIIDPLTGNVDTSAYGWVAIYIDNNPASMAYVEEGIGKTHVALNGLGEHSVKPVVETLAGGWGALNDTYIVGGGSAGGAGFGWSSQDKPGYIIKQATVSVKAVEATVKHPRIIVKKYSYLWINNTHVKISVRGVVVENTTGEPASDGNIEVYVSKSGSQWEHIATLPVNSNGEFSWEGTVDPPSTAKIKLEYVPSSPEWEASELVLPLYQQQQQQRSLGGEAHESQLYMPLLLSITIVAVSTILVYKKKK